MPRLSVRLMSSSRHEMGTGGTEVTGWADKQWQSEKVGTLWHISGDNGRLWPGSGE